MDCAITPMKKEHIKSIADLEKICFTTPWSYDGLFSELSNPNACFLVAEIENKVVGYVGMHYHNECGSITNIAVLPEYRRKGVATKLLKELHTFARAHNIRQITLEVRASNQGAISLYGDMGYRIAGVRPLLYSFPQEDGLVMEKKL